MIDVPRPTLIPVPGDGRLLESYRDFVTGVLQWLKENGYFVDEYDDEGTRRVVTPPALLRPAWSRPISGPRGFASYPYQLPGEYTGTVHCIMPAGAHFELIYETRLVKLGRQEPEYRASQSEVLCDWLFAVSTDTAKDSPVVADLILGQHSFNDRRPATVNSLFRQKELERRRQLNSLILAVASSLAGITRALPWPLA